MDPFQGLATFVLGRLKQSATALWLRLLFTMIVSATVTMLFVTGMVTLARGSLTVGFASGMVATALMILVQFRTSPLTKGMSIALPQEIVDAAAKQNVVAVKGDSK